MSECPINWLHKSLEKKWSRGEKKKRESDKEDETYPIRKRIGCIGLLLKDLDANISFESLMSVQSSKDIHCCHSLRLCRELLLYVPRRS